MAYKFQGKVDKTNNMSYCYICHVLYQLTIKPSRILLQRVRAAQLIKKFLIIYMTQRFFVKFTRIRHFILS